MDALDEASHEGSQASEILRAVLPRGQAFSIINVPPNGAELTGPATPGTSTSPGVRTPQPPYHFHGLAATQTDSQAENDEGSQKENAPASPGGKHAISGSPVLSSTPIGVAKNPNKIDEFRGGENVTSRVLMNRPMTPVFKPSKAVSFISPPQMASPQQGGPARASTFPRRDGPRAQRQRSPSPGSQDSFAGPLTFQDPERLFLESTKRFDLPLSELGRPPKSGKDSFIAVTPSSSRTGSMHTFSPRHRRVAPPSPARPLARTGEVLVEATPSQSSGSGNSQGGQFLIQSQTQAAHQPDDDSQSSVQLHHGQAQVVDDNYSEEGHSTGVEHMGASTIPSSPRDDVSTEPSSSYERLLNMDPYAPNPEPYVATQPATQGSSEDSSQPVNPAQEYAPSNDGGDPGGSFGNYTDRQYAVTSTPVVSEATTKETVSRGLLSLIPAHKRWKYTEVSNSPGTPPAAVATIMEEPPAAGNVQDTQPSEVCAVDGSAAPRSIESSLLPRRRQLPTRSRNPGETDIVPDSEPTQADEHLCRSTGSPLNDPLHTRTPHNHANSPPRGPVPVDTASSEDDGDEEDVPLIKAVRPRARQESAKKGKEKEQAASTNVPRSPAVPILTCRGRGISKSPAESNLQTRNVAERRAAQKPTYRQIVRRHSPETNEVPSSEPLQDAAKAAPAHPARPPGVKKSKGDIATTGGRPKAPSKSRSVTPAVPKRLRHVASGDSDHETTTSKSSAVDVLGVSAEGGTEPADDDNYMDVDDEACLPKLPSTRKRKRTASGSSRKSSSKSTRSTRAISTTPVVRSNKKLKATPLLNDSDGSATRVYALWKQDGHYYAGTVHSVVSISPLRYKILFDDSSDDIVDINKMRACQLNPGDQVLLLPNNQRAKVVDNDRLQSDHVVRVEVDDGAELDEYETEVQHIRIASRTLVNTWKDRILSPNGIVPMVKPKIFKDSPSPSKTTLDSAGSINLTRRLLARTGMVLTLSPGNHNWEQIKDRLMAAIKSSGGTVIEDWLDIFTMEGTHSHNNKRWIIHREDVKWIGGDVERVFLLSDDASQKPKYLTALALGIPCLSVDWLHQSISERTEKDWSQFLLPAGFSDTLNARVSQLVDLDWGNSIEYLNDIMSNPVATKLFNDHSILCIGPEFVPVALKGSRRNDSERAKESSRMVPRIILCMGASRVEAVPDVKYASESDLAKFDYVVVKEQKDIVRIPVDATIVHVGWVKDCLISGRLLQLPLH